MIGRDIVALLEGEAKRRPVVADLLARVDTLTDADIDAADVPMKWYREALREARRRRGNVLLAKQIAEMAEANPLDPANDVGGENTKRGLTLEYTGPNFWTKTRTGMEFEIVTGDWLFFPEDGGCWLNQTFFPNPAMQFAQSKKVAEQTRQEYVIALRDKWNKQEGFQQPEHMVDEQGFPKAPFTISRITGGADPSYY